MVLDAIHSVLGNDLGDGVSVGTGFVALNAKGNATVGTVRYSLEHPTLVILKFKRELLRLECSTFEHLLRLDIHRAR